MRAKHAAQIRAGILQARRDIDFAKTFGRPPMALYSPKTRLEGRAHKVFLSRSILSSMRRIVRMLDKYRRSET